MLDYLFDIKFLALTSPVTWTCSLFYGSILKIISAFWRIHLRLLSRKFWSSNLITIRDYKHVLTWTAKLSQANICTCPFPTISHVFNLFSLSVLFFFLSPSFFFSLFKLKYTSVFKNFEMSGICVLILLYLSIRLQTFSGENWKILASFWQSLFVYIKLLYFAIQGYLNLKFSYHYPQRKNIL